MNRQAYVLEADEVTGPFDETDLLSRFEAGELVADTQVCEEGTENWVALGDWLAAAVVAMPPPVLLPPALPHNWGITGGEQAYFEALGIAVTRTRLIVGPQTYAMSGITSVRVAKEPPEMGAGVALCVVGVLPILGSMGLLAVPKSDHGPGWWAPFLFWLVIGLLLLGLGIWLLGKAKPSFLLFIRTSGGEVGVWKSKDPVSIQTLNSALNRAIVERG